MLVQFESTPDRAPVNLALGLQSFTDMYERPTIRSDTRLIDAITAAEALLGPSSAGEITFRLAFRVAALLGKDDDERVAIFEQMKGYYDTRSRVVHGEQLRVPHRQRLENQQPLREWLRRLLAGFLRLTLSSEDSLRQTFKKLDSALLHSTQRSELRIAMG